MNSDPVAGKSALAAAFESLKKEPIPLSDPETLAAGFRFLVMQLPLVAPLYATLFMERLTGYTFGEVLPTGLGVVALLLGVAYFMWTVGAVDRRRRGLPMFGQEHPTRLILTGLSIWWRALIVAIRLVLAFVVVGVVLRLFGARSGTIENVLTLASALALIPTWGFAVRFWDRAAGQATGANSTGLRWPRQRQMELAAVSLVWIAVGATWWRAQAARSERLDPCQHTPMTVVDESHETRIDARAGKYSAYVSVLPGGQVLHMVNRPNGADIPVEVPHLKRFVSFGFAKPFDELYYVFEDSTGRRIIESVFEPGRTPINYTVVNPHIRLALSADARLLIGERGMPGSCTEIPPRQ